MMDIKNGEFGMPSPNFEELADKLNNEYLSFCGNYQKMEERVKNFKPPAVKTNEILEEQNKHIKQLQDNTVDIRSELLKEQERLQKVEKKSTKLSIWICIVGIIASLLGGILGVIFEHCFFN